MKKNLPYAALLVGFAADVLFWDKTPGVSYAVFIIFALVLGYGLLHTQQVHPARRNHFLLALIIFFCVMSFLRKDFLTSFLNYVLVLFSVAVLAVTFRSGEWISYNVRDYLVRFFQLISSLFVHPKDPTPSSDSPQIEQDRIQSRKNLLPILRGILLAIPILLIFTTLLSSADLVFAQKMDEFLLNFQMEKVNEYLRRAFFILLVAYFFIGIIRHAALRSQLDNRSGDQKSQTAPFLGFIETSIILGSVILLFSVFVIIQFRYLFSGPSNINLSGFTYSEYARRGFGELVAVAVFSLLLLKSLGVVSKREGKRQNSVFSGLIFGLVATVLIILVSAFQRLLLYESAYGFSQLRTYAHVFMIWLGILLLAVMVFEIRERPRIFANLVLVVLIGFTATLNVLNVDAFIARQNIKRALQGQDLDVSYLTTLTDDAVPVLVREFTSDELPSEIREEIGVALVCHTARLNEADLSGNDHWQSFHLSTWYAERALEKIQEGLSGYHTRNHDGSVTVITPDGMEHFVCQNSIAFD